MTVPHKIFLYWLLYCAVIVFSGAVSFFMGLPQLVISADESYLTILLIGMYLLAEFMGGQQIIWTSRLHRVTGDALAWLRNNKLTHINRSQNGSVTMSAHESVHAIPAGSLADLISSLRDKEANGAGGQVEQVMLMDGFEERLHQNTGAAEFLASRIVWVGILATIVGVIMAFWPFREAGMSVDAMRSNIGQFFSGVAVAFIPTAVSFVFKIALDFNARIIGRGVSEIHEMATMASASYVIPFLENHNKE